ncbi:MAG: tryptophan synthase subunit alpha [Candidatus Eremiobacteraeota bacterium]|nr:tryptophan synthase subunit alpha [Candidatus Eremiobacteraeota bacterium]MBC5826674.1 tryptophan synthase subunit alpha [Candidatus Eremiobacteraeota bacterium]
MSRNLGAATISGVFDGCKSADRAAFVAYLMAGDPLPSTTAALIRAAIDGGADIVELGFPYSDPLADGPSIQAAATRALRAGTTFDSVLQIARSLPVPVPLVAFSYFNPLYVRGLERCARDLHQAGFAGAVIPDLPPEEGAEAVAVFASAGLALSFLVAPTTPAKRLSLIARVSTGFIYVVSRMGVTGSVTVIDRGTKALAQRLREQTDKALAVGFGISTPQQARMVATFADGVIVGSALVDLIASSPPDQALPAVRSYCARLSAACRRGADNA